MLQENKTSTTASSGSTDNDNSDDDIPQSSLTAWPTPCVTVDGDYLNELYLEEHVGGPLYASQALLPQLPLPTLEETIQTLIPTVLPLATSEKEIQTFVQAAQALVDQGKVYQQRLLDKNAETIDDTSGRKRTSWLQSLWQPRIYLQYRAPLPHHVSYFLLVPDDAKFVVQNKESSSTSVGLQRAAAVATAVLETRYAMIHGTMPAETVGDKPLCMTGVKYLWHACRVPYPNQDKYRLYDPSRYQHVIVASHGQFFAVDLTHDDGRPLPLPLIQARLEYCQDLAQQQQESAAWPAVGWVTSLDRDTWSAVREEWIQCSDTLRDAMEIIEAGAFLLALDDEVRTTYSTTALVVENFSPVIHCISLVFFYLWKKETIITERSMSRILAWRTNIGRQSLV
jgi:hypothetical protein